MVFNFYFSCFALLFPIFLIFFPLPLHTHMHLQNPSPLKVKPELYFFFSSSSPLSHFSLPPSSSSSSLSHSSLTSFFITHDTKYIPSMYIPYQCWELCTCSYGVHTYFLTDFPPYFFCSSIPEQWNILFYLNKRVKYALDTSEDLMKSSFSSVGFLIDSFHTS